MRRALWILLTTALFALYAYRAWVIPETDFVAYHNAGYRAAAGVGLYPNDMTPFKYLPVVSYFFIPFSWITDFRLAKFVFFLLSFAAGLDLYRRVRRSLGDWATIVLLASFIRFHNYDFLNSQVNHVLLWLLVVWFEERKRRPWLSACVFAVVASFKVMPLLLLAPLLFLKRLHEVARILVVFIALNLIPILTFQDGAGIYRAWSELLRLTTPFPAPHDPILQSVQSSLWFWIGPFLEVSTFTLLMGLIQAALIGGCCLAAWRAREIKEERAVLCAGLIVSVITSPLAWKHNYLLLWPAVLLLIELRRHREIALQFLLMTALPTFLVAIGHKHWADRSYVMLLGAIAVFVSMLRVVARAENGKWTPSGDLR